MRNKISICSCLRDVNYTQIPFLCTCLADCAGKTCDSGEVLDKNCKCYCPNGDNCVTEDDKRNETGRRIMSIKLLNHISRKTCILNWRQRKT